MRPSRDEIIEPPMLASLALIAEANDRSLVEELNLAVRSYVEQQLASSLRAETADVGAGPRDADTSSV